MRFRNDAGRRACALVLAFLLGPLLGLLAFQATPTAADRWVIECVDCPTLFSYMTDRSLQLDAEGHPHIAYGGDHLCYAWHDGVSWHLETVDSAPVGSFPDGASPYGALDMAGNLWEWLKLIDSMSTG